MSRKDVSKLDSETKKAVSQFKDPNESVYPYNKQKVTNVGHKWEMDDTAGNETINIRHGTTGSYFKMISAELRRSSADIFLLIPNKKIEVTEWISMLWVMLTF